MRRSRINKNTEKKTQKNIILTVIGIIFILFLLFRFGVEMLVNFSLFLSGGGNQQEDKSNINKIDFIAPPVLNPLPTATNSARIIISGKAGEEETVILYVNRTKVEETKSEKDGNFVFEYSLKRGTSLIRAKVKKEDKESDFSNSFNVIFSDTNPTLEVSSPTDGQSFPKDQSTINVTGKTDPGATVTVNGSWALVNDNNNFSYTFPLQNGENLIRIVAIDQAGNKTEKEVKVNYSQ